MTDKQKHIFSVKEYGAIGDGRHDDAVGIENACQACCEAGGGIVLYPAGIYAISRTIHSATIGDLCSVESPVIHLGQGKQRTTIKALVFCESQSIGPDSITPLAFNMFEIGTEPGAHVFSSMTIDGNKENFFPWGDEARGNGIFFDCRLNPNRGNAVRQVQLVNHHSCGVFSIGDPGDPAIREQQFERTGRWEHEILVEDCTFSSIGISAVLLKNLSGGGVRGCDIDQFFGIQTKSAITIMGGKNFAIERNRIDAKAGKLSNNLGEDSRQQGVRGRNGITVASCDSYSIVANTVLNVRDTGIQASAGIGPLHPPNSHMSRRFICADNIVINSRDVGIVVDPHYCKRISDDCDSLNTTPVEQWGIIANNLVCTTERNNGISIQNAKHVLVTRNTVVAAGCHGINLGSSSYCTLTGNHVRNSTRFGVGVNAGGDLLPVGFHFIGDDNNVDENNAGNYQIPVDSHHTNIRYPTGVVGATPLTLDEQLIGSSVYEIENSYYMAIDDSKETENVYICQKIPDETVKGSILGLFSWEYGKTPDSGFFISRVLRLLDRVTNPCSEIRLTRKHNFHRSANRYVWTPLQAMVQCKHPIDPPPTAPGDLHLGED